MNFKKTYHPRSGLTMLCEVGKCSLDKLEFGILELKPGESYLYNGGDTETAFIILSGHATFAFRDTVWKDVGVRRSVFEGRACSVYMPRNLDVNISTDYNVKMAVCRTAIDCDTEPQLLGQDTVKVTTLGVKPWERETHFNIDNRCNARRLTIGETWITPGNWAGFPPHKHDVDNMPAEGILDEVYYFLFDPCQGFGIQRTYSKGEFDEAYVVETDDLVEFPKGYHTTVGAPGYNTYFLWAMAGEHQGFFRSNDPDHAWVGAVENMIKKQ